MITKDKQRERVKEIEAAAIVYANKMCNDRVPDQYNISVHDLIELIFIAGAKFADDFPRQGLVEIEDVEDIYMAWLRERECFMDYLKGRCIKAGWI